MPMRVQSIRTKFDEMTTTKPRLGVIGVIFDPIVVITLSPNMISPSWITFFNQTIESSDNATVI